MWSREGVDPKPLRALVRHRRRFGCLGSRRWELGYHPYLPFDKRRSGMRTRSPVLMVASTCMMATAGVLIAAMCCSSSSSNNPTTTLKSGFSSFASGGNPFASSSSSPASFSNPFAAAASSQTGLQQPNTTSFSLFSRNTNPGGGNPFATAAAAPPGGSSPFSASSQNPFASLGNPFAQSSMSSNPGGYSFGQSAPVVGGAPSPQQHGTGSGSGSSLFQTSSSLFSHQSNNPSPSSLFGSPPTQQQASSSIFTTPSSSAPQHQPSPTAPSIFQSPQQAPSNPFSSNPFSSSSSTTTTTTTITDNNSLPKTSGNPFASVSSPFSGSKVFGGVGVGGTSSGKGTSNEPPGSSTSTTSGFPSSSASPFSAPNSPPPPAPPSSSTFLNPFAPKVAGGSAPVQLPVASSGAASSQDTAAAADGKTSLTTTPNNPFASLSSPSFSSSLPSSSSPPPTTTTSKPQPNGGGSFNPGMLVKVLAKCQARELKDLNSRKTIALGAGNIVRVLEVSRVPNPRATSSSDVGGSQGPPSNAAAVGDNKFLTRIRCENGWISTHSSQSGAALVEVAPAGSVETVVATTTTAAKQQQPASKAKGEEGGGAPSVNQAKDLFTKWRGVNLNPSSPAKTTHVPSSSSSSSSSSPAAATTTTASSSSSSSSSSKGTSSKQSGAASSSSSSRSIAKQPATTGAAARLSSSPTKNVNSTRGIPSSSSSSSSSPLSPPFSLQSMARGAPFTTATTTTTTTTPVIATTATSPGVLPTTTTAAASSADLSVLASELKAIRLHLVDSRTKQQQQQQQQQQKEKQQDSDGDRSMHRALMEQQQQQQQQQKSELQRILSAQLDVLQQLMAQYTKTVENSNSRITEALLEHRKQLAEAKAAADAKALESKQALEANVSNHLIAQLQYAQQLQQEQQQLLQQQHQEENRGVWMNTGRDRNDRDFLVLPEYDGDEEEGEEEEEEGENGPRRYYHPLDREEVPSDGRTLSSGRRFGLPRSQEPQGERVAQAVAGSFHRVFNRRISEHWVGSLVLELIRIAVPTSMWTWNMARKGLGLLENLATKLYENSQQKGASDNGSHAGFRDSLKKEILRGENVHFSSVRERGGLLESETTDGHDGNATATQTAAITGGKGTDGTAMAKKSNQKTAQQFEPSKILTNRTAGSRHSSASHVIPKCS